MKSLAALSGTHERRPGTTTLRVVIVLASLLFSSGAMSDGGRQLFEQGVDALQNDNQEAAIERFEAARESGLDTGALYYNLGLAHYRAGDLDAAENAFRRVWQGETMRAPGAYMLGRSALRRGDNDTARTWFRRARNTARTPTWRRRATRELEEITSIRNLGYTYIAAGSAYDSNVTAASSDVNNTSEESDLSIRANVTGRYPQDDGYYFTAGLYAERQLDIDRLDYTSLRGGGGRSANLNGAWRWDLKGLVRHERLGGIRLRNAAVGDAGIERGAAGRRQWRIGYELTVSEGGPDFGFLDGVNHRLSALTNPGASGGWLSGVTLERRNRADDDSGNEFQSFSSNALELNAGYEFSLGAGVGLELAGDLTRRTYEGTEIRDGSPIGEREDDIIGLSADIDGPLANGLSWRVQLRQENRSSNIDEFDYDRQVVVGYIEYVL